MGSAKHISQLTSSAVKPSARCLPEIVIYGCLDFTGICRATRFIVNSLPEMSCLLHFFQMERRKMVLGVRCDHQQSRFWLATVFQSCCSCSLPSFSHLLLSPELLAPPAHLFPFAPSALVLSKLCVLFPCSFLRLSVLFWFIYNQINSGNYMWQVKIFT